MLRHFGRRASAYFIFFYLIKQYNTLTFWMKNEPTYTELKKKISQY